MAPTDTERRKETESAAETQTETNNRLTDKPTNKSD